MRRPPISILVLGALALGLIATLGMLAIRNAGEHRAPIVREINDLVAGFEPSPQVGTAAIQSRPDPARHPQPLAAVAAVVAVLAVWYRLHRQHRSRNNRS